MPGAPARSPGWRRPDAGDRREQGVLPEVVGLTAMALTEGLSLMQAWWAAPAGYGRAAGLGAPASPLTQGRFTQPLLNTSPQRFTLAGPRASVCGSCATVRIVPVLESEPYTRNRVTMSGSTVVDEYSSARA